MLDLFNNLWKEASTGIIGLLCTGLGILAKAGWDLWISDRTMSTQKLLDRLADNQQGLSSRGRRRLQEEAESALNEWRRRLVPPDGDEKLLNWPEKNEAIFVRALTAHEGRSACPVGDQLDTSAPLFIWLETSNKASNRYDSLTTVNELRRQLETQAIIELKGKFEKLAEEVKLSERLIKVGNWTRGHEPKLWIVAPEILIHSSEDAQRLLQKLGEEARSWIPTLKIVLEVHLPDIVREQIESHIKGAVISLNRAITDGNNINFSSSAARYVAARNEAQNILNEGIILGDLQTPDKYSISEVVLSDRLQQHFYNNLSVGNDWTTIAVFGAPGSGKTELSRLLLKGFAANNKAVVLVFSTPELLSDLELLRRSQNREEAYFGLAKSFCFRERLVPARFQSTDESIKAFIDALYQLLKDERRQQPAIFIVDDLHARREIRDVLSTLRTEANEWNLRFVLIGRTEIEGQAREKLISIKCETWNRKQAQRILTDWMEKERHQEIEIALNEGWLAEQNKFSIYLLRVIAENIDDLTSQRHKPSTLLRNAIDKHLSSVVIEIRSQPRPSSDLLLKIESMLRNGASSDEILRELSREETIDLIQLFGILSWVSHFEAQDNILTSGKIRQWSQGLIPTDQAAKDLIEAGGKAGVFSVFFGAAMWHDKLVADGCAALYLGHKVEESELNDSLVAEMIESLNKSDSIDILTLALDTPVLLRIIEAVANAKPNLADAISKLVTTEFILQLKRNPEWLNELWEHLWKRGRKVSARDITPFALVLTRLLPLDQNFETKCHDAIEKGSSDDAVLALTMKALQLKDTEQFFQELEPYAPTYLSLIVAETAACFCRSKNGRALYSYLTKLIDLGYKENDIGRVWEIWCSQQKGEDIFIAVSDFIEQAKDGTTNENAYRLFTELSFREIASRPPIERDKHLQQIKQLKNEVVELAKRGRKLASLLSKWIAFFYNPEIVNKESAWIVVTGKSNYALPKRPNKPLYVGQIFAKIRNGYPHLELAAADELRHVHNSSEGHPELVRDSLPSGFSYTEEDSKLILPVNLEIRSEEPQSANFVSKDKLKSLKLVWRPRLNLTS